MSLYVRYLPKKVVSEKYLKNVARKSLRLAGRKNAKIGLIFIGRRRMKDLNRIYRKRDDVTDVLSFSEESGKKHGFISPEKINEGSGEIFICLERAKKQAREKGHSVKKEVSILLIHGILHLAGFDHEKITDARVMQKLENKLIAKL